jgi:GABA permease
MPVMGGIPTILAPPEEARRLAQAKLGAALKKFSSVGAAVGGEVCDPDPMHAVEAAVTSREFDEIIVSTLPARLSRWLHQDLPGRLGRKFHLPVTHVAARDV